MLLSAPNPKTCLTSHIQRILPSVSAWLLAQWSILLTTLRKMLHRVVFWLALLLLNSLTAIFSIPSVSSTVVETNTGITPLPDASINALQGTLLTIPPGAAFRNALRAGLLSRSIAHALATVPLISTQILLLSYAKHSAILKLICFRITRPGPAKQTAQIYQISMQIT